jgi:hypothetical protein
MRGLILMKFNILVLFILIMMLTSGCSQTKSDLTQPDKNSFSNNINDTYPITVIDHGEISYPIVNNEDEMEPSQRGPDFSIDEPVRVNDTIVTGSGPANVPILLINVSFVGEVLASTTINESGHFLFEIDQPLEVNHSIGLQLGDISGTEFRESQFLYNEKYYERPFIGIIFFMTTVTQ